MDQDRFQQLGKRLPACLLVLLAILAYLPALDAGFIIDDTLYVTDDARMETLGGLGRIWTEVVGPQYKHQYYPMTSTAFWVQHQFWSDDPFGYHLVNVLLHAANAVLFWLVLGRLAMPGAWIAAAIFAVHPVHVQSVAWVAELKNTLSAMFFLASALVYVGWFRDGPRKWAGYALGMVLFVAALLSKSATCLLPAALLVVLWWTRRRLQRRDLVALAPLVAVGLSFVAVTVYLEAVHGGAAGSGFSQSALERGLVAGRMLWFYTGKIVWPAELIFIYPRWVIDAAAWWQYLFPVSAIGVLAALWWQRARIGRGPFAAVAFFFLAVVPMAFVNVAFTRLSWVSDHWQYWASMGLIALAAGTAATHRGRWLPVAATAVIGVLAVLTWDRCLVYGSSERLWRDTVTRNPDAWLAHNNLANALQLQDRFDEAEAGYREAIRLNPDFMKAHYNLANALQARGRLDEAVVHFDRAVRLDPEYADAHYNFGNALRLAGDLDEAIERYREALRLDPDFHEARHNLRMAVALRHAAVSTP